MKTGTLILAAIALSAAGLDSPALLAKGNQCYRETPKPSQVRAYPCPRLTGSVLQTMHAAQANIVKRKAKNPRPLQLRPRQRNPTLRLR
jgi:hypothetical protein